MSKKKYPKRQVWSTKDPQAKDRFYAETDDIAPLGPYQIATGVVQNPRTNLWQVWISTNGLDINHITAHKDRARAVADIEEIKAAAARGDLYDNDKVMSLFVRLEDLPAVDLPRNTVLTILRDILHNVIDQPEPE